MNFARPAERALTRPVLKISDPSMIARLARQMADVHPGTVVIIGDHKEAAR